MTVLEFLKLVRFFKLISIKLLYVKVKSVNIYLQSQIDEYLDSRLWAVL